MSEPILEPVTLTTEQSEMVEDLIHTLKVFRSTGNLGFLVDACRSFKRLGDGFLDEEEAPLNS